MTDKKFDLSTLIPKELHEQAKQAGREAKRREEEVEWHCQNDPNFEEWYAARCKQIDDDFEAMTTHMTFAEIDEMLRKQHEQETKSMS